MNIREIVENKVDEILEESLLNRVDEDVVEKYVEEMVESIIDEAIDEYINSCSFFNVLADRIEPMIKDTLDNREIAEYIVEAIDNEC